MHRTWRMTLACGTMTRNRWKTQPTALKWMPAIRRTFPFLLPSSFGVAACKAAGISAQVEQEIDLRIGQANDALHQLRVLLGHKVYLYRTSIRHNKSQKGKTRAFSSLGRVQMSVRDEYRVYAQARRAMIRLGAGSDLLARYQLLTGKDLKITTAAYDPSVHAQRSSKLAWFWKMDGARAVNESSWMKECR